MKAIRYHVARHSDVEQLIKEVNKYLESDWQPSGGIISTVITNTDGTQYSTGYAVEYAQALVLYERV